MNIRSYSKEGILFTEVTNDKNLKVVFANLWASIFKINYDNYVLTRNVKYVSDFYNPTIYYGKTIGRVSNRMKGHAFILNGLRYELEPNEGNNVLHGGKYGLSYALFDVNVLKDNDKIEVVYTHVVKHLEDGYPGNLNVEVKYIVYTNSNEIDIEYNAVSDMDTVLSLCNHSYFTLGCKSIRGLTLEIDANNYLKTDGDTLLAIDRKFVTKALDFRTPKRFIRDLDDESLHSSRLNGYDHYYYFEDIDIKKKRLSLSNAKFQMDIYTNYPGIQIYTSGFDPQVALYPNTEGLFDSVAIEPSDSFKSLHLLKKDTLYSRTTKYIFINKENK